MREIEAKQLAIGICETAYDGIKNIQGNLRSKIATRSTIDVMWKPDLISLHSIKNFLSNQGIKYTLVSEAETNHCEDSEIVILVDELEGTRNFKDKKGPFAISVSILKPQTNPSLKILTSAVLVQDTWGKRIYSADTKHAYLDGKKIKSTHKTLNNCAIAIGDYDTSSISAKLLPTLALYHNFSHRKPINALTETVSGVCASAIDLCYCADPTVRVVGYIDLRAICNDQLQGENHSPHVFDLLPSVHILENAGGKVTDVKGKKLKFSLEEKELGISVVAGSNPSIYEELFDRTRYVMSHKKRMLTKVFNYS